MILALQSRIRVLSRSSVFTVPNALYGALPHKVAHTRMKLV